MTHNGSYKIKKFEIPRLQGNGFDVEIRKDFEIIAKKDNDIFEIFYPETFPFGNVVIIKNKLRFIYRDYLPCTDTIYLLNNFEKIHDDI